MQKSRFFLLLTRCKPLNLYFHEYFCIIASMKIIILSLMTYKKLSIFILIQFYEIINSIEN